MTEDPALATHRSSEHGCPDDLGGGVLLRELLAGDGPHPCGHRPITLAARLRRPALEAITTRGTS